MSFSEWTKKKREEEEKAAAAGKKNEEVARETASPSFGEWTKQKTGKSGTNTDETGRYKGERVTYTSPAAQNKDDDKGLWDHVKDSWNSAYEGVFGKKEEKDATRKDMPKDINGRPSPDALSTRIDELTKRQSELTPLISGARRGGLTEERRKFENERLSNQEEIKRLKEEIDWWGTTGYQEEAERLYKDAAASDAALTTKRQSGQTIEEELETKRTSIDQLEKELQDLENSYYQDPSDALRAQYEQAAARFNQAVTEYNDLWGEYEPMVNSLNAYNDYIDMYGDRIGQGREANFLDITWNSAKQGYYNSLYGEESFAKMLGSDNNADMYKDILAGEDYRFHTDSGIGQAVSGAMTQLGQLYRQMSNPTTIATTGGAIGAALVAGNAGPQALVPEEALTVPAAAYFGYKTGSAMSNMKIEGGLAYQEMLEMGVSEDVARIIGLAVGGGNAALEGLQLDELLKGMKVSKSAGLNSATDIIFDVIKRRWPSVANNVAQEVAQEGVTIAGTQLGSKIDKGEWAYDTGEVLGRLADTAVSSTLTFSAMEAPGAVMNVAGNIKHNEQLSDVGKQYQKMDANAAAELVETGLSYGKDTEAYKVATEVKTKLDAGEKASDLDTGRMVAANMKAEQREEELAAANTPRNATESRDSEPLGGVSEKGDTQPARKENAVQGVSAPDSDPLLEAAREAVGAKSVPYNVMATENPDRQAAMTEQERIGYGEEGMKLFREIAQSNSMNKTELMVRFDTPYQAGLTGLPMKDANLVNDFQIEAYNAGRMDHIARMAKDKQHKLGAVLSEAESGFDHTGAPKSLTQAERNFTDFLFKKMGIKGSWDGQDGKAKYNAFYDSSTGGVTFAQDFGIDPKLMEKLGSEDFMKKVERLESEREESFIFYVAHEVATHVAMNRAPAEMRAFVNAMYNYKQGMETGENLARGKQTFYAKNKVALDTEGAIEEVVADAILDLYHGDAKAFMDAMYRIANGTDEQAKKGARTYKEMLSDFIKKLKAWARKLTGRENAEARANVEKSISELEQLRDMFEQAISTSMKAVETARQNPQSEQATGEIKNSIKNLATAAGIEASRDPATGKVVFKVDGKVVSKITPAHIREKSGLGGLITTANENGFISGMEAQIQYKAAADIMNMIINTQDPEMVWAWVGSSMFSAIKSNADGQYGTTVDFTTVCRKTQDMITAMSKAMMKLKRGLTKDEVTKLQAELIAEGSSVPCPVCYVFSRWAGIGSVLDNMHRWQEKYDGYTDAQLNEQIAQLSEKLGKGKTKDLVKMLREQDEEYDNLSFEKEKLALEKKQLASKKKKAVKENDARTLVDINNRLAEIDKRNPKITKRMNEIKASVAPELAWLMQVRAQPDYAEHGKVRPNVLFNLDDAATFAEEFPLAWKYRTSRGPSAGKAILPYSDMRLGDIILGVDNNSADGNKLFANATGAFTDEQKAAVDKAIKRAKAQNLIGGQRFQSTSDFRYDYALDYLMAFWELQAIGSKMQTYTKIVEFGDMVAAVGGDFNLSVMPRNKGYITLPNGKNQLVFSSVTGIDFEAAKRSSQMHDNGQLILVGINDQHILAALEDSEETRGAHIGFVIPYHASGASINEFIRVLVSNLGETYQSKSYQDYSDVQSDKERGNATAAQKRRHDLRTKLLRGKDGGKNWEPSADDLAFIRGESVNIVGRSFADLRAVERKALRGDKAAIAEYESWTAGALWDLYNKMWVEGGAEYGVRLNTAQAKSVMPHEYWNKTVNRDQAYINGFLFRSYCYNLGLTPRFTGSVVKGEKHGDFSDSKGYWKTLIDRPMYRNDGTYRAQQLVNMSTFNKEMLKPSYAKDHWDGYAVQEPDVQKATRAAERFMEQTGEIQYSLRTKPAPKKVGIAYKVFYAKNGQLYPPMVPNPGGAGTPVGVWLDADVGEAAAPSKTGRPQVKAGGKGTQGGSGSLAFRPGWHLGDLPMATQFNRVNPETGKKELVPANFVWAECEYAMDHDYQDEAMSYGYTENGKFRHAYAGLPRLPEDGYYRYRTNPNPDTVPWVITGAMRVKRILTDAETDQILRDNGVEPLKRQGGPIDLEKLGIKAGEQYSFKGEKSVNEAGRAVDGRDTIKYSLNGGAKNGQNQGAQGSGRNDSQAGGKRVLSSLWMLNGATRPVHQWAEGGLIVPKPGSVAANEADVVVNEYGLPVFVVRDSVFDQNHTTAPAFAADGQVFLRETLPDIGLGDIGAHEAGHAMKQRRFDPYIKFLPRVKGMMNQSDLSDVLKEHAANHCGVDLKNCTAEQEMDVYDEICNLVMGAHHAQRQADLDIVRGCFNDFDSYRAELVDIHEQFKWLGKKFSLKGEKAMRNEIKRIRTEGTKAGKSEAEIENDIMAVVGPEYGELIKAYGEIKRGERPVREIEVPRKTEEDRHVSRTIRTVLEAEATPEAAVPTIQQMIAQGDFSYDVITDKAAMAGAEKVLRTKGYATALGEWISEVKAGKVSKANTAIGWALYNQAANEGDLNTAMTILNYMVGHQRNAAQAVQATRILKKMTPDAQLYGVVKSVQALEEQLNEGKKTNPEEAAKAAGEVGKAKKDAADAIGKAADGVKVNRKGKRVEIDSNMVGEPFVFEYAQKVGEALAAGLEKRANQTEKQRTFLQEITAQLNRFAAEKFAKEEKGKKLTAIDLLRDYIQNQSFYAEAWQAAQIELREKFADNPMFNEFINSGIGVDANANPQNAIFMRALVKAAADSNEGKAILRKQSALGFTGMADTIAEKLIEQTGATGEMAGTIRDAAHAYVYDTLAEAKEVKDTTFESWINSAMKDIGLKLSDVVMSGTGESAKQAIVDKLVSKYGFGYAEATYTADVVAEHFDRMSRKFAENRLKAMFSDRKNVRKTIPEQIERLARLGAFDAGSAYNQKAAERIFKTGTTLTVNEELAREFLKAKTQEERDNILADIYRDIGRQMPSTFVDKWNAWRYLAMLGNPRTHVRNILGNAFFAPVVATKDLTATGIERAVNFVSRGKLGRTKAMPGRELLMAAWADYANVADEISGGGKYSDAAMKNKFVEEGRVIFKTKALEKARTKNSEMLEREDVWFAKPHYAFALAQYCKAHGVTADQLRRGKALGNARAYAIKEAQKATYRDTNAFSETISELGRYHGENKVKKGVSVVTEGILPFRKTPANILVRGLEYSPMGLLKGLTWDLVKVKKGDITAADAIDNIAAGLTGTGLLAFGLWAATEGLIRGAGGDDEEEKKFEELQGHQAYALELPDGTSVTLDWLSPEALPVFVGVNLYEMARDNKGKSNLADILTAVSNVTEPLLEMSCLQSLNDLFDSVGYATTGGLSALPSALASAVTSYLTQAFPTILGQAERSAQDVRMTTYTEKDKFLTSDMQYTLGKISARVPGWDFQQIPYIDAWGRTESTGSRGENIVNNFLNPAYMSQIETSAMEAELQRLYEATGEPGVLPDRAQKKFTVNKETKHLTAEEYVEYATEKGQRSYEMVSEAVSSPEYQTMTDSEKAKAVDLAYDVADAIAKTKVSDYEPDGWVANAIKANEAIGMDEVDHVLYKIALDMVDQPNENGNLGTFTNQEKADAIESMRGLTNAEKAYLWNKPEGYDALDAGVDMDAYIRFKAGVAALVSGVDYREGSTDSRKRAIRSLLKDELGLKPSDPDYKWLWSTEY